MSIQGEYNKWLLMLHGFYSLRGNTVGGNLHVQLDDGNLEDQFWDDATKAELEALGDWAALEILHLFRKLSMTQRGKLHARFREQLRERYRRP